MLDRRAVALGPVVEHVTFLVADTALDGRVSEHGADRSPCGAPRTLPTEADKVGGATVKFYELQENSLLIAVGAQRLRLTRKLVNALRTRRGRCEVEGRAVGGQRLSASQSDRRSVGPVPKRAPRG